VSYPGNALIYKLMRAISRALFTALTKCTVTGLENLPPGGPLLIVSNHLHWLDPPLVMAFLPYRAAVLAAAKYRRSIRGLVLRACGAIFVNRGEVDRVALRKSLAILRAGGVLGIAPEGTRSPTGGLQQGKKGAAYLAYRTDATLLPVVVWGVENVFPSLRRFRRASVGVAIGAPFKLPPVSGKPSSQDLVPATDLIMSKIAALLPARYRGVYDQTGSAR